MIYLMTTKPPYKFARAPSKEICHKSSVRDAAKSQGGRIVCYKSA